MLGRAGVTFTSHWRYRYNYYLPSCREEELATLHGLAFVDLWCELSMSKQAKQKTKKPKHSDTNLADCWPKTNVGKHSDSEKIMIWHKQINQGSLIRCLRSIQDDIHSRQGCYLLFSRRSLSEVTESSCCNHSKSQRLAERYKDTCGEQSPSPGHCWFWQFSMWLQNKM